MVNLALSWRWTFRILGIAGLVMTPITMMAVYEPKAVRLNRKERMSGKSAYSILVCFRKCKSLLLNYNTSDVTGKDSLKLISHCL